MAGRVDAYGIPPCPPTGGTSKVLVTIVTTTLTTLTTHDDWQNTRRARRVAHRHPHSTPQFSLEDVRPVQAVVEG